MTYITQKTEDMKITLKSGLFSVLAILFIGVALGYATGFDVPTPASAQFAPIVVTAPPITMPVIAPPPPFVFIPPPIILLTPAQIPSFQSPTGATPSEPEDIVVTGSVQDSPIQGPPCCTVPTLAPAVSTPTPAEEVPTTPVVPSTPPPILPPVIIPPIIIPPIIVPPVEPPVNPKPVCTLIAGPTSIQVGGTSVLTWTTTNATTFVLDNSIGAVTPVAGGTRSVSPTTTTTYTGLATGPGGTVTCAATITVTTSAPVPACVLTASPTAINSGDAVTLSYSGTNISTVFIDNGVGTTTSASGNVTVNPTANTTYTGTFTATNGQVLTCTAGVTMNTSGGGGGGGGGGSSGGGGGGNHSSHITLDVLPGQVLGEVSLSQIPYTGLDLGPVGTAIYWLMLTIWSLAAAYLLLFVLMPVFRRARTSGVASHGAMQYHVEAPSAPTLHALNQTIGHTQVEMSHTGNAHSAPVASVSAVAHAPAYQAPTPRATAHEGFRAYATGDTLTIDDIVKGLSRESGMVFSRSEAPEHTHVPEPVIFADEYRADSVVTAAELPPLAHTVSEMSVQIPSKAPVVTAPTQYSDNIAGFLASLLQGDRDAVFGAVRGVTSSGGSAEEFLSHAVCALDDAYRARTDGTQCHPEIARITADLHTTFLEKLVTSLATAVDSSYSAGITGTKLALTRALSIVNG